MIYRAIQLIQIFCAHGRTDGRTNEGNPRGPRGPKNMVLHIKMHKVHIYAIDICQKYKSKISRKLWIKEKSAALTVLQQLVHKGWIVRVIEDTFWRLCSPEMFLFNDPSKYLGSVCNHTFRIPSPSFFVIRQDFWISNLHPKMMKNSPKDLQKYL